MPHMPACIFVYKNMYMQNKIKLVYIVENDNYFHLNVSKYFYLSLRLYISNGKLMHTNSKQVPEVEPLKSATCFYKKNFLCEIK